MLSNTDLTNTSPAVVTPIIRVAKSSEIPNNFIMDKVALTILIMKVIQFRI
jgi:hypothetical protein